MARTDACRLAALTLALVALLLPATAAADHPSAGAESALGADHVRQHAKIWKMQAKARARWKRMSRAERRRALRRERRYLRRQSVRARAAAVGDAADVGTWVREGGTTTPFVMTSNYEGYAIHAAMLHTGKVLMWGYPIHVDQVAFRGNESYAWLWDPSKGYGADSVESVTPEFNGQNVSIYCSGMSFLPDGKVLLVGGTENWGVNDPNYTEFAGLNRALLFDPVTETWEDLPRPAGSHGRWYPTQTLMPNGKTFVISGFTEEEPGGILNDGHEIFDPETKTFQLLTTPDQRRITELYPHMFVMPDGKLLMAGPDPDDSAIFDPGNLADPWTNLPHLASQRIGSNAVIVPEGPAGSNTVAVIGGRPYDQGSTPGLPPAYDELIDLDDPTPSWTQVDGMHTPRSYLNTIQLPDRSMVAVGGDSRVVEEDGSGEAIWPPPERGVELYDPITGNWRAGPTQVETRAYHSTALLLPDGRVLSTGDDFNPTVAPPWTRAESSPNDTGEIYSPPYLFKGPRPVISKAPSSVDWDVPFGVQVAGDIDEAVLIAPAAVTHANDMNQRLVPLLTVSEHENAGVTLKSPPSDRVAPPGWYMLFLLNDGVPSIAKWVRLDGSAPEVPAVPDPFPAPDPEPPADPGTTDPGTTDPGTTDPGTTDPGTTDPGTGETPGGEELPDFAGPRLRLRFAEDGWLKRLRRYGKLRVRVTVDEPATVAFKLIRSGRTVARARVEMTRAGSKTIDLKPRRSTLRWLRRARTPKLRFSVIAVDAAENDTAWTRLLKPALGRR